MKQLDIIRQLINEGEVTQAIKQLEILLLDEEYINSHDEVFYLLGNAYRKLGNWQQSLNHYQKAIDINPDNPALQAKQAVIDILEFFHKDMYNQ